MLIIMGKPFINAIFGRHEITIYSTEVKTSMHIGGGVPCGEAIMGEMYLGTYYIEQYYYFGL